jgi:hypothetical protein
MRTVPEIVAVIVRKSPFLEEGLGLGILNHSALARLIRPEVEREAQKRVRDGAVIVALNRLSRILPRRTKPARRVFRTAPDLNVRLSLFEVTYANSEDLVRKQKALLERRTGRTPYFLTFTRGINETTIIASRELRESILAVCRGERLIAQIDKLASVTVMLPPGTALIPGVYSYILKALAWEGFNIVEVVSTLNEFTIVLEDKTVDAAFSVIKRLFEK